MALGRPAGDEAGCAYIGIGGPGGWGEVDGLPVGVVEVGLGPEGLVGGGVDGGVAYAELVGAIEREDGLAEGDGVDGGRGWGGGGVCGARLLWGGFRCLRDADNAEGGKQQGKDRLRYIPSMHVWVTNKGEYASSLL